MYFPVMGLGIVALFLRLGSATFWSCEELSGHSCAVDVVAGQKDIRGIAVKYWRYRARSALPRNSAKLLPLVALHGGPAWPHNYLLPLKHLVCHGISEVIFYDQAGCGDSQLPQDEDLSDFPHLLDPTYYSQEELPTLLDHWKLDRFYLLGHSWGTMLAQLFSLNVPSGMEALILSGPLSDSQRYIRAQWDEHEGNLGSLPPFVQQRIHHLEKQQRYDSPEYEAINAVLTTFFTVRTAPGPDCFVASAKGLNKAIYVGMQGASEFTMSGVLGHFNVTARLHEIKVPVLLTSGRFDTMRPSVVRVMQQEMQNAEWKMFPHSGHISMINDADENLQVVVDFLSRVHEAHEKQQAFVPKDWDETVPIGLANRDGWRSDFKLSTAVALMIVAISSFAAGMLLGRSKARADEYVRML